VSAPETVELAAEELRRVRVDSVLLRLGSALELAGAMDDLYYFLEKPWKWAAEYRLWCQHGQPIDAGDERWEPFLVELEEVQR